VFSYGEPMSGKRILVVDDDSLLAKTIGLCLSKRGHKVNVFNNGAGAVKHLFEEAPDLIVADLRLPDCDGWFLAHLLEKMDLSQKIPLIIISVLDPDRGKVAAAKPSAYIQKPFDMGQLMEAVERNLNRDYLAAA
jgi:DNA-binding response OmpR family regulator